MPGPGLCYFREAGVGGGDQPGHTSGLQCVQPLHRRWHGLRCRLPWCAHPKLDSMFPELDSMFARVDSMFPEVDSMFPEVDSMFPTVD